ncbi:hypothetical protein [Legionella fallonii]|uniref:Transmembrane protein n=1 Tax=Legionella fallonii LLAP-10 TaxID=1212491 RepID=A0A098G9D2_9GAMM|nr:hypothetical protein [Legionella fallonii]CEG58070.1 conserved exported protein of unknown function [Legionella fallonii LLAP-10]
MKKQVTKYYTLLLLAIMFAAPGVAAYLFYQHPTWLSSTKVNKGTLLTPPVELGSLNAQAKWQIIFWSPGSCEQDCLTQLNVLARVRLALGRKLYLVDQKLILGDNSASITDKMKKVLREQDFHLTELSKDDRAKLEDLSAESKIFIANPDNFLVMSYRSGVNPDDVYKDIKLLLNTTEKKSG